MTDGTAITYSSAPHVVQVVPGMSAVVVYVLEMRAFIWITPLAARLLERCEPPDADDENDDGAQVAWWELRRLKLIRASDGSRPEQPADGYVWRHCHPTMEAQLATPLQTPFDPSGPDAWEEEPAA